MMNRNVLFSICLFSLSPICWAQINVVPKLQLSAEESNNVRQAADALKNADLRAENARLRWANFCRTFQAHHPELSGVRLTDDFRVAYSASSISVPMYTPSLATVDLSVTERNSAQNLYSEKLQSQAAFEKERQIWRDVQNELIAEHVSTDKEGGTGVKLSSGQSVIVPVG